MALYKGLEREGKKYAASKSVGFWKGVVWAGIWVWVFRIVGMFG